MADAAHLDGVDEKSKLNESPSDNSVSVAKIKFQPASGTKNGEAKIDIGETGGAAGYQCGLTKEELMKYANDPFWIALRRVLFVLFWLLWLLMLVGAVVIIIVTPKCAAPKEPEWYENTPVYVVRVDKFADSDSNGAPDLAGLNAKVDSYVQGDISISAVALEGLVNPEQPDQINKDMGTIDDFKTLTEKIKALIVMPLSKIALSTEENKEQMTAALKYWLDKGAAGFIFDDAENQAQTMELAPQWKSLISNYSTEEFPKVSVISSYTRDHDEHYCSLSTMVMDYSMAELKSGFSTQDFTKILDKTVKIIVVPSNDNTTTTDEAQTNSATKCRNTLVLGSGDIAPMKDRYTVIERDRIVMFSLMADATPFIYFGDEYGKSNGNNEADNELRRDSGAQVEPMNWSTVDGTKAEHENSFYNVFTKTALIRKTQYAVRSGDTVVKNLQGSSVVAMSRVKKGNPAFVVVTNFGEEPHEANLSELGPHIPDNGHVDVVSSNSNRVLHQTTNLKKIMVATGETVILQFVPIIG